MAACPSNHCSVDKPCSTWLSAWRLALNLYWRPSFSATTASTCSIVISLAACVSSAAWCMAMLFFKARRGSRAKGLLAVVLRRPRLEPPSAKFDAMNFERFASFLWQPGRWKEKGAPLVQRLWRLEKSIATRTTSPPAVVGHAPHRFNNVFVVVHTVNKTMLGNTRLVLFLRSHAGNVEWRACPRFDIATT